MRSVRPRADYKRLMKGVSFVGRVGNNPPVNKFLDCTGGPTYKLACFFFLQVVYPQPYVGEGSEHSFRLGLTICIEYSNQVY